MTFAEPILLVALALIVPIVMAFLFKERRETVRVPSTHLWQRVARSKVRSKKMRNLLRMLALAACIGALVALAFAAADPMGSARGETVAIVVDVSASMGGDGEGSLLDQAKDRVRQMLRARGSSDRVAIVAAGAAPIPLAEPTHDGAVLSDAVDRLHGERGGADLAAAIAVAEQLVRHAPNARIVLVSDGGEASGEGIATPVVPFTEVRLPRSAEDNVGITTLAARPPARPEHDDDREILVAVATSSNIARRVKLTLHADTLSLGERTLEIPPSGEVDARFTLRVRAQRLVARIAPVDDHGDGLASDDVAEVAIAQSRIARAILIVGKDTPPASSFFARQALSAAGVEEVVESQPDGLRGVVQPGDVAVVLDQAPLDPLPIPALYLATSQGRTPVRNVREVLDQARSLRSVDRRSPLLAGVALDSLTIERALTFDVPEGAAELATLDGGPVIVSGGAGDRSFVYVGLDPLGSDLVLRVAFPVLIANSLSTLTGASKLAVADTLPRSEIALVARQSAQPAEPSRGVPIPFSPAAALAGLAAMLLLAELAAYRKGWLGT